MGLWEEVRRADADIKLLWLSVFLRLLAYGLTNQVLALFLSEVGMSQDAIGWFMSLTLVGDVGCSYVLTWYADAWGRRRVLVYGSVMMMLSGLVFAYSQTFYPLLFFAIFGVISPSSNEVGPFKSIEESMIAHLTPHSKRPEVYAIHALVGTIGGALGAILCGGFVDLVTKSRFATTNLQSYKLVFLLYALFALAKVIIMLCLSEKVELEGHGHEELATEEAVLNDELAPLIEQRHHPEDLQSNKLSKKTVTILWKLLVVFMIDSLGSGFMTSSWMVYYYAKEMFMSPLGLGILFFCSQLVMASSTLPSSFLARHFGPVKATLLVQVPSGVFSILIPLAKKHLSLSMLLLNLHFSTTAMDVTPRQILLTNIIRPKDLTRVMGVVNIGKTCARCVGPIFTGLLSERGLLWTCYIISGALVISADAILAVWFLGVDTKIQEQLQN